MSRTKTLTKVLDIREREKDAAQKAYNQAMQHFEDVATKLYQTLKKKEDAEESYDQYLKDMVQIDRLMDQMAYIESLNRQIVLLQYQVNQARTQMELKQQSLTHAHIEVKKFEKLIETRKQEQQQTELKQEQMFMDDMSVQQFLSQKQGGQYGKEIG